MKYRSLTIMVTLVSLIPKKSSCYNSLHLNELNETK